jgi:hypothetical protein
MLPNDAKVLNGFNAVQGYTLLKESSPNLTFLDLYASSNGVDNFIQLNCGSVYGLIFYVKDSVNVSLNNVCNGEGIWLYNNSGVGVTYSLAYVDRDITITPFSSQISFSLNDFMVAFWLLSGFIVAYIGIKIGLSLFRR